MPPLISTLVLWAGVAVAVAGVIMLIVAFVTPTLGVATTKGIRAAQRTAGEVFAAATEYWDASGIVEVDGLVTQWNGAVAGTAINVQRWTTDVNYVQIPSRVPNDLTAPVLAGHKGVQTTPKVYMRAGTDIDGTPTAYLPFHVGAVPDVYDRSFVIVGIIPTGISGGLTMFETDSYEFLWNGAWAAVGDNLIGIGGNLGLNIDGDGVAYYAITSLEDAGDFTIRAHNVVKGTDPLTITTSGTYANGTDLGGINSLTTLNGNKLMVIGVSFDDANLTASYYVNGARLGTASPVAKATFTMSASFGFNFTDRPFYTVKGLNTPGIVFWVGAWNSVLSDADHLAAAESLLATYGAAMGAPDLSPASGTVTAYVGTPFTLTLANTGGSWDELKCSFDVDSLASLTGLTFNTTSGILSGTPTNTYSPHAITITATNAYGSSVASLTLRVLTAAADDPVFTYSPSNTIVAYVDLPLGQAYTIVNLGVTTPTVYSISPALPTGMTFNTATGEIAGTPTELSAAAVYTVTGTGNDQTGTRAITVSVVNVPPPDAPALQASVTQTIVVYFDEVIDPIVVDSVGGEITSAFYITPDIHTLLGLDFDTATGTISGRPNALQDAIVYAISADGPGGTGQVLVSIQCITRHIMRYSSNAFGFTVGTAVRERVRYVDVVSGDASDSIPAYLVGAAFRVDGSDAAIAGVAVDKETGDITGTPTEISAQQAWTVVATSALVSLSTTVSVRSNGTFEFSGTKGLRAGTQFTLKPVVPAGETISALVTGLKWPSFLTVFSSKSYTVSGVAPAAGTYTLDCTVYFASGAQSTCAQEIRVEKAQTAAKVYDPPLLYSGSAAVAAGAVAVAAALVARR